MTTPSAIADHYARAITDQLAACVLATTAALAEPRSVEDRRRAFAVVGHLGETLAGLAIGCALAPVLVVARRFAGPADEMTIARVLAATTRAFDARARRDELLTPCARREPGTAPRPLVDELTTELHRRVLAGAPELRAAAVALLAAVPPEHHPALAAALAAELSIAVMKFGDRVDLGWETARAVLAGAPPPDAAAQHHRALWAAWYRRVTGERRAEPPTFEPGEYILRVA